MINVKKLKYKVIVLTETGTQLDITNAVKDLGWSESEKELASKVTFTMLNASKNGKSLSQQVKLGCKVIVQADWGGGMKTVATATIQEATEEPSRPEEDYQILAYDCLYNLLKSSDDYYKSKGKTTTYLINDVLGQWGLSVAEYKGPNVTHDKQKFQNKKISDILLDILEEAKDKGGGKSVLRTTATDKIAVVKWGTNDTIWALTGDNSISSMHKVTTANMVTRVKIMSTADKKSAPKVEATVSGDTTYGVFQKIITHKKKEKLSEAKAEAQKMVKENGKPEETSKVVSPDIPPLRKGDKIYLDVGALHGYFYVVSVSHDADAGKMTTMVKKPADV